MADALGVALFLFVASLVQGFLGFGFGIVAMTGLTVSHDLLHASGVVNLGGIALTSAALVTPWFRRRNSVSGVAGSSACTLLNRSSSSVRKRFR